MLKCFRLLLATLLIIILTSTISTAAKEPFPIYKEIQPNVSFWTNIYGTYTSRQGILHDRNNLSIVYAVIDLVSWDAPGSARINQQLVKLARKRIKNILSELGHGKKPVTTNERKIYALFPKTRHTTFLKARDNIRLQIGQKDRFKKGVIRSGKYINTIKKIFRKNNLPAELAYLPHVESSFNPKARSKAGAAGLWQFTRSTGRIYMQIDNLVDERLDPITSTRAAAKLLKENHAQLKTWPLALTAYNYGRSGMLRAVSHHKKYVPIFKNYRQGHFKFASRNFYSEFIAAVKVAGKLEKNKQLKKDKHEGAITIKMKGYISFKKMKSFFRISKKELTRLNPALLKPVTDDIKLIPKGYVLRLPVKKSIRLKSKQLKKAMFFTQQRADTYYIVRKGDTVGTIASKYKTTSSKLARLNQLNNKSTIRVGQKLAIPQKPQQVLILKDRKKKLPGG